MNTFGVLSLMLLQLGLSLRFNEQQDSAAADVDSDEGRRRRRRRRRRGPSSPSSTGPTGGTFRFLEEFLILPSNLAVANQGSGAAPLNSIIGANGWLNQHVLTASEDTRYVGVEAFNFQNKKSHMFQTRVAMDDQSACDFFVGLAEAGYVAAEADPGNGIGFWMLGSATDLFFLSQKGSAGALKVKVQTKLVGGGDLVIADSGMSTQSGTVPHQPLVSYRLGWTYVPEGQYGVAAVVGSTGEYRVFLEGVQVGRYNAVIAGNPLTLLKTKSTATGTGGACNFMVDYIDFEFARE